MVDCRTRKREILGWKPGPEVIKLLSCSTQLSIKFKLFIDTAIAQIN